MIDDFDPDAPSGDALWARARSDYAAGESASAVCERYRLNRSTFFARAKSEGWRRSDAPNDGGSNGGPDPYVAEMEAALVFELMGRPATPAYVLLRRAWAMTEIALLQRRRIEAQSWIRIARDLRKLVLEETGALTWTRAAQMGEETMPKRPQARPPSDAADDGRFDDEAFGGGAVDATVTTAPAPQARAPEEKAASRRLPDPEWGILPMSICTSRKKLEAFLYGEFADAWAAVDSSDRSDRTADSAASSPPAKRNTTLPDSPDRSDRTSNASSVPRRRPGPRSKSEPDGRPSLSRLPTGPRPAPGTRDSRG